MYTVKKQVIIVYSSLGIGWLLLMIVIFSFILSGCNKEVPGGSGNIDNTDTLRTDIFDYTMNGSGNAGVKGSPAMNTDIQGSGRVIKL